MARSQPWAGAQAEALGDPIEFVKGVELDDDAAALAISSGLDGDAGPEMPLELLFEVDDVGGLAGGRGRGLAVTGQVSPHEALNLADAETAGQGAIGEFAAKVIGGKAENCSGMAHAEAPVGEHLLELVG